MDAIERYGVEFCWLSPRNSRGPLLGIGLAYLHSLGLSSSIYFLKGIFQTYLNQKKDELLKLK